MFAMLLGYAASGDVVATLDYMVARNEDGEVVGLVDFAAHEAAGGEHTDIWLVAGSATDADGGETTWTAKGSKVWPEWLGGRAHEFRVELEGPSGRKRISALVHRTSGHRRERAAIEAAIAAVESDEAGARDIRHIVGGPQRPLVLDDAGRTGEHPKATGTPGHLPLIGR